MLGREPGLLGRERVPLCLLLLLLQELGVGEGPVSLQSLCLLGLLLEGGERHLGLQGSLVDVVGGSAVVNVDVDVDVVGSPSHEILAGPSVQAACRSSKVGFETSITQVLPPKR